METCRLCGRTIAPVSVNARWALTNVVTGDPYYCPGWPFGGHVPRGEYEWLPTGVGTWMAVPMIRLPGASPQERRAIEVVADMAADPVPNTRIVRGGWDGDVVAEDFAPAGTACSGCGLADLPVRGPAGAELCRYCDELRIEKPAGNIEISTPQPAPLHVAKAAPRPPFRVRHPGVPLLIITGGFYATHETSQLALVLFGLVFTAFCLRVSLNTGLRIAEKDREDMAKKPKIETRICPRCAGSRQGATPGSTCPVCHGTGRVPK